MFRWISFAVFVTSFSISAWRRRCVHRNGGKIPHSEESGELIVGRFVVALPLFGSVIIYLLNPHWMAWASLAFPEWLRWTGAVSGILAVPSMNWVLVSLGTNVSETVLVKARHQLVTSGPYQWVRHPLYPLGLTIFLSIGLMAANWFILLWGFVAAIAVHLAGIPREEAHLKTMFGDDYRQYCRYTGSLFPSLKGILAQRRTG